MEILTKEMLDYVEKMILAGGPDQILATGILCNTKTENKELRKRKITLLTSAQLLNREWLPKVYPSQDVKEWFVNNIFNVFENGNKEYNF